VVLQTKRNLKQIFRNISYAKEQKLLKVLYANGRDLLLGLWVRGSKDALGRTFGLEAETVRAT
jgi:hypothetical protein